MKWLLATVIAVSPCGGALAQVRNNSPSNIGNPINTVNPSVVTNPTANSNSNASSQGGQGGTARGGAAGATANPASTASSGSSSVAVTTGNTTYPANQTILSVPAIYVPSIATGNVCALGASAGASWLGAGFAVGTSWESMQCERRQTAALLFNMGTTESKAAAKEVLCNSPEIRNAYLTIGHPCAADMMKVAGPVKPTVVAVQPVTFNAAKYAKASDCLTAAQAAGAALSLCAGKQ